MKNQTQLIHVICANSERQRFKDALRMAMREGSWVLVQQLQLEPSWISYIEELSLQGSHYKFRLWLTLPQYECPEFLLKSCVKVAL